MSFYGAPLPRCDLCHSPAAYEIKGPHNASYGHTCGRHLKGRIAQLEKTHKDTKVFPHL